MQLYDLLKLGTEQGASDLHLSAGHPAMLRIDGRLQRSSSTYLTTSHITDYLAQILSAHQLQQFQQKQEIDCAIELPELGRFRINVFQQQRGAALACRYIATQIKSLSALGLDEIFQEICQIKQGLVLVTGATGTGKSTTLAAMLDYINQTQAAHIITLEDPIEFIHHSQNCLIQQREIHTHSQSFNHALRAALREDPDIILIGELRDLETIRLALTAAETGHLVFASLHTASAAQSIHRLIDVFPATEKQTVRHLLAESLQAVIAQTLLKKTTAGRIAVHEIMLAIPAIRHLIRDDKISQINSCIQTGAQYGMRSLAQSHAQLRQQGIISSAL
ncbi:type IV pilus twitching motility protein PilT [Acinetobacter larvae]|uniref:Twitching motility protein PilT n=1 Tax=Acinetobacter larvae TaxID=1789224 RepID=A0A1B2M1L7_9GAMM|nr:PilT/PilU family type 4a pilus ATPase [Acinetobacter larvae]AOA59085.1 twitching motility protein PilT [Acinetobacter larvae]